MGAKTKQLQMLPCKVQVVIAWSDQYENEGCSHQISTQLNIYGRFWKS